MPRMRRTGQLVVHLRGMRRQGPSTLVPERRFPLLAGRRPKGGRVELLARPAGAAIQQSVFLQGV